MLKYKEIKIINVHYSCFILSEFSFIWPSQNVIVIMLMLMLFVRHTVISTNIRNKFCFKRFYINLNIRKHILGILVTKSDTI